MIKKILISFAAILLLLFCLVAALQPDHFQVERSAVITASPAVVFAYVNDHHKFAEWNPWAKLDPNCKNTYSGPDSGVGAACSWSGNSEVGAGTSTIIESKLGEHVRQKMDWKRPMEGTAFVDFTLQPEGDKTRITWSMHGTRPFIAKAMSLFIDCDEICGTQFEQGFTNLETLLSTQTVTP